MAIGGTFIVIGTERSIQWPGVVYALSIAVMLAGGWLVGRVIIDLRRDREWEFRIEDDRLTWLSRDRDGTTIDAEIVVRDIRSLVYHPPRDDPAFLDVEFVDGSLKRLSFVGAPSDATLLAFINYWRATYDDIPIQNLEQD